MTDKYEEFKKWLKNQSDYCFKYCGKDFVFEHFEEYLEKKEKEKEKERQVKSALLEIIYRSTKSSKPDVCVDIDRLYHELKDVGVLK